VDTQTRHALKKDKFAQATASSVSWLSVHRSGAFRWGITIAVVLALVVGGWIYFNFQSDAAATALGSALDVYTAALAQPGAPAEKNVYATAGERAKAANQGFQAVIRQYGWLPEATRAHYFAGITDAELGQNADAENELKAATGAWDRNIANLARLALAGLYHRTGRDPQAVDLYNAVAAKPSDTVPTTVAQLDLAELYAATGKQDQARAIWAKVKDADKDGTAGSIAAQKLAAKQ
jgi:tetratricopeptide (TPR) repeat protein